MKMQTGMRVEVEVWRAYRALCSRERLRPSVPVEEFLRLALENDSAVGFLTLVRDATKAHVGGFDAYARVLLDWYSWKTLLQCCRGGSSVCGGLAIGDFESGC